MFKCRLRDILSLSSPLKEAWKKGKADGGGLEAEGGWR